MRIFSRVMLLSALVAATACDAGISGGDAFEKGADGPGLVPGGVPTPRLKIGELEEMLIESPHALPAGSSHTEEVFSPGATFVKVHFGLLDLAPGDELIISDAAGNVVERKYYDNGTNDVWGVTVPGDTALVTLNAGFASLRQGFAIDKISRGIVPLETVGLAPSDDPLENALPYAICGADDKKAAACFDGAIATSAQAIGQMSFTTSEGSFVCTGELISAQNHFITNNHCVSSQADVNTLEVTFNFQNASCGGSSLAPTKVINGGTFLKTNPALDYTLVQLPQNPAATFGFLQLDGGDVNLGQEIYIPQHPGGRRKEIAVTENGSNCTVKKVNQNIGGYRAGANLGYTCDTEGGSSGSAVISRSTNKMIALHHLGGCENSGVYIRDILPEISSFLGQQAPAPTPPPAPNPGPAPTPAGTFSGSATNLPIAIPDNAAAGIERTITVPSGVVASQIIVDLDIRHTFRGDLTVKLTAPTGQTATISNRAGGAADDLTGSFDVTTAFPASLNAAGTWRLSVVDAAAQDVGTLQAWTLRINPSNAPSNGFVGTNADAKTITDNDANGIGSVINVNSALNVQTVKVELSIAHSWRGDLEVTLTSPSGQSRTVVARSNPSDSADNIVGVFSVDGFTGNATGNWTLRVRDMAAKDIGTLNFWRLGVNADL